ncbi:MAG: alanine:cation symporter family protein, partial [Bacteroidota bacterium]
MNQESIIAQAIVALSDWIWGVPLLLLVMGGGLYFLFHSRFLPFRLFGHAIEVLRGKHDDPNAAGQINHYEALSTALAATVGMGNISGVAVAIAVGGPGAILWMWVSAIVGMATKYYTCSLAIMYRGKDSLGEVQGGPMYVITEGMGKKWKPLAILFCLAGIFGCLPAFTANQLTQAVADILLVPAGVDLGNSYFTSLGLESGFGNNLIIGLILTALVVLVIWGGLKRISTIASKLVPFMVALYFLIVLVILFMNYDRIPQYLGLIVSNAFT